MVRYPAPGLAVDRMIEVKGELSKVDRSLMSEANLNLPKKQTKVFYELAWKCSQVL